MPICVQSPGGAGNGLLWNIMSKLQAMTPFSSQTPLHFALPLLHATCQFSKDSISISDTARVLLSSSAPRMLTYTLFVLSATVKTHDLLPCHALKTTWIIWKRSLAFQTWCSLGWLAVRWEINSLLEMRHLPRSRVRIRQQLEPTDVNDVKRALRLHVHLRLEIAKKKQGYIWIRKFIKRRASAWFPSGGLESVSFCCDKVLFWIVWLFSFLWFSVTFSLPVAEGLGCMLTGCHRVWQTRFGILQIRSSSTVNTS